MDSRLVQGRAPYPEQVRASISKSRDREVTPTGRGFQPVYRGEVPIP